jgi:DNA-binding transcriptional LysR family regulator
MLEELNHLALIATHGSFTEAARRAGLSQPALSASIARLEEEMGARLFFRGAGGTRLTAAGEALLPRARAALAAVDDGRRAVAEIAGLRAGEVRLGGGATVCTFFLPPVLAAFRRDHPGIVLKLRELMARDARAGVEAGELDLGFVADDQGGEPWLSDELVLVAAPGTEAAGAPFVTFSAGASTRVLLERNFPGARVVMELSGVAAVLAFVRAGVGVSLVSRIAVAAEIERGTLVEVRHARTPIRRDLFLIHRGVERLSPAAAAVRARLLVSPPARPGSRRAR